MVKEVAEYLGEDPKKVSAYFTGFLLPDDNTIRQLCELFDVDFNVGSLEFQHAHRKYTAEHKRTLKGRAKSAKVNANSLNSVEDVLEVLFSRLSCDEFISIYELIRGTSALDVDPMRIIYNKVDYDTYNRINSIMLGE